MLGVLARHPRTGVTFTVARLYEPTFDTAVTAEQLAERYFVLETDIGSLGLAPGRRAGRPSWELPVLRGVQLQPRHRPSGWGVHANRVGVIVDLQYEFRVTRSADLTEAIWQFYETQRHNLGTQRPSPDVTLEESSSTGAAHPALLPQVGARGEPEGARRYLVHFSPRTRGDARVSLIEFGFSGDQTLLAYVQTVWGRRKGVPLYVDRARPCSTSSSTTASYPTGLPRPPRSAQRPIHPLVHRHSDAVPVRRGRDCGAAIRRPQMRDALMPIAARARRQQGNYLRTMCESVYPFCWLRRAAARPPALAGGPTIRLLPARHPGR